MSPFPRIVAAFGALLLGTAMASAAPTEGTPPADADAVLRSTVDDPPAPAPAPAKPNEFAPAGDAIPGAQTVKPPTDCPNGTLRTAIGDVICR